jgi:hypothetical protein
MLASSPINVLDLARQRQAELARQARQGYVRYSGDRRRRLRRRR